MSHDDHYSEIARIGARAQGIAAGVVLDDLRKQKGARQAHPGLLADAQQATAANPPPVDDAPRPVAPSTGPLDAEKMRQRQEQALRLFRKNGDARELQHMPPDVHPEYFRWAAEAYDRPDTVLARMVKSVREPLRHCATKGRGGPVRGEWARSLVSLAWLLRCLAQETRRSGVDVVAGLGAGALAGCIPSDSPNRDTRSRGSLLQRRHAHAPGLAGSEGRFGGLAGDAMRHDCGQIEALRQLGIVFAWQPPSGEVPRWQTGWRGFAFLQFLLPHALWKAPDSTAPT